MFELSLSNEEKEQKPQMSWNAHVAETIAKTSMSDETVTDWTSNCELDSHANMIVLGRNAYILNESGKTVQVSPFRPSTNRWRKSTSLMLQSRTTARLLTSRTSWCLTMPWAFQRWSIILFHHSSYERLVWKCTIHQKSKLLSVHLVIIPFISRLTMLGLPCLWMAYSPISRQGCRREWSLIMLMS